MAQFTLKLMHGHFLPSGKRDAAISVIREAKDHIPNEPAVYFNLANMLGQKDEFPVHNYVVAKLTL